MNKTAAREWLTKAWHHLSSGRILYEANHYTDTIAVDLHYAVEISLKSFLAFENKRIPRTHDLIDIYESVKRNINFDADEISLLDIITTYHIKGSYPTLHRTLPTREEIWQVLIFTEKLFSDVCAKLGIDVETVKIT
ncbi:MAG: HEPN domain-containing protein [Deltaproteobacteria bacterium]|nr:HEPN domain-containing protein [Candidatus Anaeroferrophillacea bacterium]